MTFAFIMALQSEDIEHLTYRFSRFAQLFPRGNYTTSYKEFINDMDMCRKYGFYNNQRLFAEMLDKIDVQYEFLSRPAGDDFKEKWYSRFVPPSLHKNAEKHYYFNHGVYSGFLWHVFSYGDLDCPEGKQAAIMFDAKQKDKCIIFFSDHSYAFKIINARNLYIEVLNDFSEIFVVDINFTWTYVRTHEYNCGPYFYEMSAGNEEEVG